MFGVTKQQVLSFDIVVNKTRGVNILQSINNFQSKVARCLRQKKFLHSVHA